MMFNSSIARRRGSRVAAVMNEVDVELSQPKLKLGEQFQAQIREDVESSSGAVRLGRGAAAALSHAGKSFGVSQAIKATAQAYSTIDGKARQMADKQLVTRGA